MRQGGDSKADQDKKLFVGGLHPATTENELREFYSQWGEITDVVVMKDQRTGKSRGFGFVTFADASSVDVAQSNRPHHLGGKQIDSKRAMPREETSPEVHAAVKKIFVGALKKHITNEDLTNYFSSYGNVVDAQVVMSKERNESRGFAFVTFDDTDAVDKVILSRPHTLMDSKIDVRKALSKEEMGKVRSRPPRPDMRQGWSNGSGYNYENPPPPAWGPPMNGASGGFGSYGQQHAYAGGPMRGAPPPYPRPTPYAGQNSWQR
ncbi:unnamed protein product [Schistocephalus solidus]|uniref:Heterogeneous nuclear ribonucleoprotein A1 n=1 Tax=Schistocephalus solidus TaxID=70667 RepID=A0A183TP26_SCHSO|nr:unnamed protein product [Schistocephalus solidus]